MTPASGDARPPISAPPRAAAFIVTVYGDVVEPRGGVLATGALIGLCARAGLSETLVRTALSRLVAAGQLAGRRAGRRSFYGLTPQARVAFRAAARAIFRPPGEDAARGWLWLVGPRAEASGALARDGFAEVAPRLWLGPDREAPSLAAAGGARMFAAAAGGAAELAAFAARHWDLGSHAARYRAFLAGFAGLAPQAGTLAPPEALALRLRLVNDFRLVLLGDPRLPVAALPADWPGDAARRLFCRLYADLSPAAEAEIAARLEGPAGPLPAATDASRARLAALAGRAAAR
ncbi:MAG: PaaX family transcriptional regulator [Rhodobacteraceae bacterium]|nr:PaaX family transcriptional regulator [Paracoccaceae bacterium]